MKVRYDIKVTRPDGTTRYIECKRATPNNVLNGKKIKNNMESAQDKFADPSFNPSETVLDINGKDSIVNIDVNNMDNLLNDINSGMSDLLTDPDLPSTNRIGELKIVLNDRTLTFVKDGNVFRLPKPGDVVI